MKELIDYLNKPFTQSHTWDYDERISYTSVNFTLGDEDYEIEGNVSILNFRSWEEGGQPFTEYETEITIDEVRDKEGNVLVLDNDTIELLINKLELE